MSANLLPLEKFREIMAFNPWHFYQLENPKVPIFGADGCSNLVKEYAWQFNGGAGRAEIRAAIATAEQRLADYLNYKVAPTWIEETIRLDFARTSLYTLSSGYIRRIGTPSWELVEELEVTLSDTDGDGLLDTFTCTTTMPTGISLDELAVFFLEANQVDQADEHKDWQIRPAKLKVSTNGLTLTITGRSWLLVKPNLYEGLTHQPGYDHSINGRTSSGGYDPDNVNYYVEAIGLYKLVITDVNKVLLTATNICDSTVTPVEQSVGIQVINADAGTIGLYNNCCYPSDWACCSSPQISLTINYEAGGEIEDWQTIVARLAAAELMRKVCGCAEANQELFRWQVNDARAQGTLDEQYRISNEDLANFLGTRAGQVYAYKLIKWLRLPRAIAF